MPLQIVKATKVKSLLRGAIFGPAGSGKTFTSLKIAAGFMKGMPGKKIGVIDTERRAQKYADRFDFDLIDIAENSTIAGYGEALEAFAATGEYGFVIIDSATHAWEALKDEVSRIGRARYKGNEFAAWSEGTPMQRAFIDKLIMYPIHILWTMRSATEWKTTDENGKTKPVRIGLKPEQGKSIEYEADFLLEMTTDHICTVLKDTSGKFQDKIIERPDEKFGAAMFEWLNTGIEPPPIQTKTAPKAESYSDIENALMAAKSIEELKKAWDGRQEGMKSLSDVQRAALAKIKDEVKAKLLAAAEKQPEEKAPAAKEEGPKREPLFEDPPPYAKPVQSQGEQLFGSDSGNPPPSNGRGQMLAIAGSVTRAKSKLGLENALAKANALASSGDITEAQYNELIELVNKRAKDLEIPHAVA